MIYGIMVLNLGLSTRTLVFVDEYLTPHKEKPEVLTMFASSSGFDFYVSSLRGSFEEMRKIAANIQIEVLKNSILKGFDKVPQTKSISKECFQLKIKLIKNQEYERIG